ncbi:MAG: reverse transcriptase family protein, partial [Nitrospira sp.]|nr:reverse transcriptase family protein [Nitrospira sp.]
MTFEVEMKGSSHPFQVLVDSGATHNYVRRASIKDLSEKSTIRRGGHTQVRLADGTVSNVPNETIRLQTKFLDFDSKEDFFVFDLDQRYDLILGVPWLKKHQPWIDWVEMTLGSSQTPQRPVYYGNLELSSELLPQDGQSTPLVKKLKWARSAGLSRREKGDDTPSTEGRRDSQGESYDEQEGGAPAHSVDEVVINVCNLSELPQLGNEIVQIPEMGFDEFRTLHRAGDIRSIAMIEVRDLLSTSTMDDEVLDTKVSRFENQGWAALKSSRNPFHDLLWEYRDVFPDEVPCQLPSDKGTRHEIVLEPGSKYCVTRQWPLPKEQVKVVDDFFAARKAAGQVRESNSPHSSPTFCVKKATGGWRLVHAYNKLNAVTIPAQTPIPRKDVIIDGMTGSTIFSTIDLRDGFYQILMRESDIPYTAVSTPSGMLWEYLVMPQGLKNAPATFNRCVTHLLRPCREFAPSYFDDLYVHSKAMDGQSDVEIHRGHLRQVLQIMRENDLYANLQKCMFGVPEIPVLGDFVGVNGVRADPEK